jgi:hypothetical protein
MLFLIAQMLITADNELFDPFGNAEALMKPGGKLHFFGDVRVGCRVFLDVRALQGH